MIAEPYIPAKTAEKMNGHYQPGTRHAAMFDIAMPLIGNGMAPEAVFAQLRATFPDADKSDKEIEDVVRWCSERNPTPSGYGPRTAPAPRQQRAATPKAPLDPKRAAIAKMDWWLNGVTATAEAVATISPQPVPADRLQMAGAVFRALFGCEENINILCAFTVKEGKANPQGSGKSLTAIEWAEWIGVNRSPEGEAGAWMRMNPTARTGTGADGAFKDSDITAFRFVMIESDWLLVENQLAFYLRSKLPIACIVASGGDSAHAWIRVDAKDAGEYAATVALLLSVIEPFGFDKANKNPSRLTRLPGAKRALGAKGEGIQRLLYLNPNVPALTPEALDELTLRLAAPLVSELPFRNIIQSAVLRYQELQINKGKLGVPTGIVEFDKLTGGLKNGQMIVIAAQTGGGKTTLSTNIINTAAWHHDIGVALFTLEMDRDEICDLLVAINCGVDRNAFNNGNFTDHALGQIGANAERFGRLPLWIADDPVMTVEQIRARVLQLKAENRIGLVVVDYLQFVSGGESYRDNREQQVAAISRALRSLAKEAKLPVIALSQLNDEGKIRESRVIAHDAHVVFLVEEAESGDLIAKVVKGRSIPKGEYFLKFEKQFGRLTSHPLQHREPDVPRPHPNSRKR